MNGEEERVKLACIKNGIYNTKLPSWKDIEKDDQSGKLSDEHIRSSVPAGTELPVELFYQYNASSYYIPNYEVLPLYHMKWQEEKAAEALSFLNNPHLNERWQQFKKYLPLGQNRILQIPQVKDFHFLNYHVRYQKPEVRSSWKNQLPGGKQPSTETKKEIKVEGKTYNKEMASDYSQRETEACSCNRK